MRRVEQNHALATYAPKIQSIEARIDWSCSAEEIQYQIRAFAPYPGAFCYIRIQKVFKRLKIFKAQVVFSGEPKFQEGVIPCGNSMLKLLEVQLEGKRRLPIKEFLSGLQGDYHIN